MNSGCHVNFFQNTFKGKCIFCITRVLWCGVQKVFIFVCVYHGILFALENVKCAPALLTKVALHSQ